MKEKHLCHVFPAFDTGGPQVRVARIINASDPEAMHTVISLNGDFSCSGNLRQSANVRLLSCQHQRSASRILALARMLRELRPNLLLTYGWGGVDAVLAARKIGFRQIIHEEDGFVPEEGDRQLTRRLWARRFLFRLPALVALPSLTLVNIAKRDWKLPAAKLRYIPNGVECDRFSSGSDDASSKARETLGIASDETVIGTVGQLRPEKNQDRLLRVFASARRGSRARLLIVGDGPLRNSLQRRAVELGIADRTVFAGLVPDPVSMYRAMDVFAMSSDTEQMPIAMLEAMSHGLPVVSTDVGDIRAMVSAVNRSLIISRSDESGLAAALADVINDAGKRRELGEANRQHCLREYQMRPMIDAYLSLYREILDQAAA